jgi:predicted NBD/HSP70 family sugar kinase
LFANLANTTYLSLRSRPVSQDATLMPPSVRSRAVQLLRQTGPVSRAGLARRLGVSRSSMSSVVTELLRDDVVIELAKGDNGEAVHTRGPREAPRDATDAGAARVGRPGVLLALNPQAGAAIGVDFGHRHVRVILCDLAHSVLAERHSVLPLDYSPQVGIGTAGDLIDGALSDASLDERRVVGIGMGLPGPIDFATGQSSPSSISPAWVGVPAAELLRERTGQPVLLENDANLGALAELVWGAGRQQRDLVYVKVATGVGAGIVTAGKLLRGAGGVAGEIGHVTMDESGPACRCGNRGCLEVLVGADSLLGALRGSHRDDLTAEAMVQLARDGDRGCCRVIADAGRTLGIALANVVNVLNPAVIVVGGELSRAGDVLLDPIRSAVERGAIHLAAERLRIVVGELGARAEALGAVALVLRETDSYVAVPG